MGFMQNVRVIQADQANKLSKRQLKALDRMAPPVPQPWGQDQEQIRLLNARMDALDAKLARIIALLEQRT